MKIKNRDLGAVCTALFNLGNHQGDITKKWAIAKIAKKEKKIKKKKKQFHLETKTI